MTAITAGGFATDTLIKFLSPRPRNIKKNRRQEQQGTATMRQATLATAGFERYSKPTRRAAFLAEMNRVVPWRDLCALIEPVYPTRLFNAMK